MNIITFKDCNGQDIVADLISETETELVVKNPLLLMITEKGIIPIPYITVLDKNVEIKIFKTALIARFEPAEKLVQTYTEMFGGIVKPSSKIITQ